jgi:hypothetical protein
VNPTEDWLIEVDAELQISSPATAHEYSFVPLESSDRHQTMQSAEHSRRLNCVRLPLLKIHFAVSLSKSQTNLTVPPMNSSRSGTGEIGSLTAARLTTIAQTHADFLLRGASNRPAARVHPHAKRIDPSETSRTAWSPWAGSFWHRKRPLIAVSLPESALLRIHRFRIAAFHAGPEYDAARFPSRMWRSFFIFIDRHRTI